MWQLDCGLCKESVDCSAGISILRKHIKAEHEVARYKVEVVVALCLLTTSEERRLVEGTKERLQAFEERGEVVEGPDLFAASSGTLSSNPTPPPTPTPTLTPAPLTKVKKEKVKDTQPSVEQEICEIQRMLMEDNSDDEAEKEESVTQSKTVDDERLLLEDDDEDIEVIFERNVEPSSKKSETKIKEEQETRSENILSPTPTGSPSESGERLAEEVYNIKLESNVLAPQVEMEEEETDDVEEDVEMENDDRDPPPFCRLCYVTFSSHADQLPHEQKVHNSEEDRKMLNADMTQLTLESFSSTCTICGLRFLTSNSLSNHQKVDHRVGEERTVECAKCHKVMKPSTLKGHMIKHKERTLDCILCHTKFNHKGSLKSHQKNVHKDDTALLSRNIADEDLTHECKECDLKFVADKFLEYHNKREHSTRKVKRKSDMEKKESCYNCSQVFTSYTSLRKHAFDTHGVTMTGRKSTASKKHKCDQCTHSFKYHLSLRKHSLKNHNIRLPKISSSPDDIKIDCPICLITYDSRMKFNYHTKWVHRKFEDEWAAIKLSTAGREVVLKTKCDICEKMVFNQHTLKLHTGKVHSERKSKVIKEHKCGECEESFKYYTSLRKHTQKSHGKKLPSQSERKQAYCKLCRKSFTTYGSFKSHTKTIHSNTEEQEALNKETINAENLIFKCKNCNEMFLTRNCLNYHQSWGGCNTVIKTKKCSECDKSFKFYISLRKHTFKSHGKTLPKFPTSTKSKKGSCEKNNDERKEVETRTDCPLCTINFDNTKKFREHINNFHRKDEDERSALKSRKYVIMKSKCKFCEKKVFNQRTLRYHFDKLHREDENKKVWSCDYCKKEFRPEQKRVSHLTEHMRDDHNLPGWSFAEASQMPKAKSSHQNFQMMMARLQGGK